MTVTVPKFLSAPNTITTLKKEGHIESLFSLFDTRFHSLAQADIDLSIFLRLMGAGAME